MQIVFASHDDLVSALDIAQDKNIYEGEHFKVQSECNKISFEPGAEEEADALVSAMNHTGHNARRKICFRTFADAPVEEY